LAIQIFGMQNSSLAILLIYILMRGLNYTELILLAKQLYTNRRYWEAGQKWVKVTKWSLVNTWSTLHTITDIVCRMVGH
jgi:hypothetical protein